MIELEERVLLEVKGLKKYFPITKGLFKKTVGYVKAVDGISLNIKCGETLGLVGESGCGKSTLGRSIIRLIEPLEGQVIMDGVDILSLNKDEMRKQREKLQIIFQDPFASLNPRMTVGDIVEEPLKVHKKGAQNERNEKVIELLKMVGLNEQAIGRYPHQFSGGQRQRIGIARALALNPELVICDEPVSALDVSVRSQVLNLMNDLKEKMGLTFLFISHDLSVVKHISDRVAVMYLGRLVEIADKNEIYNIPFHPYTEALMSAIPIPDPEYKKDRIILKGDVPSPANPPSGCYFHTRCLYASKICEKNQPELVNYGNNHYAACHKVDRIRKER
ncbi:ABC transporter ATP-binding protein [Paratissierella segnis]|jgi:oligopeptide transport system ATP-binding protein|uniref:Dipeptide ABC transporter ATP-binding protein n=1 Tax=Paratissierella segnis TaxID=2763679 RepID=A0A926EXB4_9FIRM|nr:dipeptide ABC transporter ATP-binding protein [Paratissierella segnis]MBC8588232.1 dipeptide ABC transporter ATP-binding protein [Paratissierella segnis]